MKPSVEHPVHTDKIIYYTTEVNHRTFIYFFKIYIRVKRCEEEEEEEERGGWAQAAGTWWSGVGGLEILNTAAGRLQSDDLSQQAFSTALAQFCLRSAFRRSLMEEHIKKGRPEGEGGGRRGS